MLKQGVDYRGGESVVSMAKILQNAAHVWMEIAMMTIDPVRGLLFVVFGVQSERQSFWDQVDMNNGVIPSGILFTKAEDVLNLE